MSVLPPPPLDRPELLRWVSSNLGDLSLEGPDDVAAGGFAGGQSAADAALATLDIAGYARRRSTVLPVSQRGASRMSPYLRHGLLSLREVWDAVSDAPTQDRHRYRDELMWAEYARHVYARAGAALGEPLRREQSRSTGWSGEPWPAEMACMESVTDEL